MYTSILKQIFYVFELLISIFHLFSGFILEGVSNA